MVKPTLLVLAAGLGSRYGGLKQMVPVGPHGATLIDYSVFDALRSGFGRLVFVIRRDIEEPFKQTFGARFEKQAPVQYIFQELGDVPAGFSVPAGRTKPWGTGHAILSAAGVIQEPFGVVNGDDLYGVHSLRALGEQLGSGSPDYAMVGFILRNTLSRTGTVARGVCHVNPEGYLSRVTEITSLRMHGADAAYTDHQGQVQVLNGGTIVSMNLWGFNPGVFGYLRKQFAAFLEARGQEAGAEFFIPTAVNNLVEQGRERCRVLETPDRWCGMTCREDHAEVVDYIRAAIESGTYPGDLWG